MGSGGGTGSIGRGGGLAELLADKPGGVGRVAVEKELSVVALIGWLARYLLGDDAVLAVDDAVGPRAAVDHDGPGRGGERLYRAHGLRVCGGQCGGEQRVDPEVRREERVVGPIARAQ